MKRISISIFALSATAIAGPMAACSSTPGEPVQQGSSAVSACTLSHCPVVPKLSKRAVRGDVNGDGRSDIALAGGSTIGNQCQGVPWSSIPVAFSVGNGTFQVSNAQVNDFPTFAQQADGRVVMGDFDGDGRSDIAATGGTGWNTLPVAFSNGDGTFRVTNKPIAKFSGLAALVNKDNIAVGDFDGDGKDDIAIAGGSQTASLPIAFSNGDGTFRVTNLPIAHFGTWANSGEPMLVSADFNNDSRDDLALVGGAEEPSGAPWATIPVAFSNGDGTFRVTNDAVNTLPGLANEVPRSFVFAAAGDFDGDGKGDIALAGGQGWQSIPIAFSVGNGTFRFSNQPVPNNFATFATQARSLVAGDFNRDGRMDLALTGGAGWNTVPVAFSKGDGTFQVTNENVNGFAGWATPWATISPEAVHFPTSLSDSRESGFRGVYLSCEEVPTAPPSGGKGIPPAGGTGGGTIGGGTPPTCGVPFAACCALGACDVGSFCGPTVPVCTPCGGAGQPCCPTAEGLACGIGLSCQVYDDFGDIECAF